MESLALVVMAITLGFGFIAMFAGFVIGDVTSSMPIAILGALVPAFVFGWYTQNVFVTILWAVAFGSGHVVGSWFRGR